MINLKKLEIFAAIGIGAVGFIAGGLVYFLIKTLLEFVSG